ncbi:MAG: SH3 domain-containing protein, partial [Bacillota bacterium]|nr:SH3 domain-containing protein [Bacillota bacterium]
MIIRQTKSEKDSLFNKVGKRIIITWILSLSLLLGMSIAYASQETAVVATSVLNVRSAPGTSHTMVTQVKEGDKLTILDKQQDWYLVALPAGGQGWIANWLVTVEKADSLEPIVQGEHAPTTTIKLATISADIVNVRGGAGTSFPIIAKVKKGQQYTVVGEGNDWIEITLVDGQKGWVAGWLAEVTTVEVATSSEHPGVGRTAVVIENIVNVRNGPDISADRITQVSKGQEFIVLQEQHGWYQIKLNDKESGWIAGWLVSLRTSQAIADRGETSQQPSVKDAGGDRTAPMDGLVEEDLQSPEVEYNENDLIAEAPEGVSLIQNISLDVEGSSGQLKIEASTPLNNIDSFVLKDPNRIVIDFDQAYLNFMQNENWVVGQLPISKIRFGQFAPEQVRVVIELSEPLAFSINLSEDHTTLTIDLSTATLSGKVIVIDPGHGKINGG